MSVMILQGVPALSFASSKLRTMGITVTHTAGPDVTHLLLPIPSFSGGSKYITPILNALPRNVTICGGSLNHLFVESYHTLDFLQDPYYLAGNAAITADCAIELAGKDWRVLPVLILGWGRIGKCLAHRLSTLGADVTIAARKDGDLAMAHALGLKIIPISRVSDKLLQYRAIFNTVPALVIPNLTCHSDCVSLDLASTPGIEGPGVITARGLPGKYAPERSGTLIAKTFARLVLGREDCL